MAAPIKPALVRAYGNDGWGFVTAVANPSAPTLTEIQAATGLTISCMLFGEQEGVSATTEKVTLPRILCETEQFEANGPTTYSMSDLMVSFSPQAAAGSNGKKAWETLVEGATGFLWRRQGIPATDDTAVGQFVDLVPIEIGTRTPTKTGTGADGVYAFTAPTSVTGAPTFNVAIVV
jgi:hypothetical protein